MADQKSSPPHFAIKNKVSSKAGLGKRAAIYTRISTGDQHAETQLYDPVNWRSSADLTSSTHTLTPFLAQNRNA
jgi:hypothetical protein